MAQQKKQLTHQEEFELMKLMINKFLWVGVVFLLFGAYKMINGELGMGFLIGLAGAVIMLLFVWLLVREFEYAKR